jgi:hypothetical protein
MKNLEFEEGNGDSLHFTMFLRISHGTSAKKSGFLRVTLHSFLETLETFVSLGWFCAIRPWSGVARD